ncbi:hypothetical protein AX15_006821 [Amanita polypyramis BW_CC]|nr:hypothetical protein AX15_006821 [Amanita polypyramis BW_CC]
MDWLNSIVKVEHPSLIPALLHSILTNYGKIDAFLPCNTNDATTRHFFVRYNSPRAAKSAYNNQYTVQGLRVSTLCQDPDLLDQYLTACSLDLNRDKPDAANGTHDVPEKDAYTQPRTRRRFKGRKSAKLQPKKYPEQQSSCPNRSPWWPDVKSNTLSSTLANPPAPKHVMQRANVMAVALPLSSAKSSAKRPTREPAAKAVDPSSNTTSPKPVIQRFAEVSTPTSSNSPVCNDLCFANEECTKTSANPIQLSGAPCYLARSSVVAVPATFCMATKVELRVAGEQFIYDLNKLEDDPKSIIELLKLASVERAHWMVVGAFYRRRGKTRAAIKVMTELLKVLKGQSVDEEKMKPIYLMLSGCEADLAKARKSQDPSSGVASTHYLNSQTWLQKVYGTFDNNNIEDPEQLIFNNGTGKVLASTRRNSERLNKIESRTAKYTNDVGEACSNKRRKLCMSD